MKKLFLSLALLGVLSVSQADVMGFDYGYRGGDKSGAKERAEASYREKFSQLRSEYKEADLLAEKALKEWQKAPWEGDKKSAEVEKAFADALALRDQLGRQLNALEAEFYEDNQYRKTVGDELLSLR